MANEITTTVSLQYANPTVGIPAQILQKLSALFSITGKNFQAFTMSVPTTAGGTAIPLGALASLGFFVILNLDPTNYVTLMTAASGTNMQRILPGVGVLGYFDPGITAPALLAHTSAVEVQGLILEV